MELTSLPVIRMHLLNVQAYVHMMVMVYKKRHLYQLEHGLHG